MSKQREPERCWHCDEPAGRAGRADDSLYDALDHGPYCRQCWNTLCESVEEDYDRMKAIVDKLPTDAEGTALIGYRGPLHIYHNILTGGEIETHGNWSLIYATGYGWVVRGHDGASDHNEYALTSCHVAREAAEAARSEI